jgi:hypothetical protein
MLPEHRMLRSVLTFSIVAALGCSVTACGGDPNAKAVYNGAYPVNCRAYVQASIDAYRKGEYSADETFRALERNCGEEGDLWER